MELKQSLLQVIYLYEQQNNLLQRFKAREFTVLCNVKILLTGIDVPEVKTLLISDPTTSEIRAAQRLGRVTRRDPEKICGLVIELLMDASQVLPTFFLNGQYSSEI
jgi:superfamily II DNA or RNA helicase